MKSKLTNASYIAKLKTANHSDAFIAARLGITEDQVKRIWDDTLEAMAQKFESGLVPLSEAFNVLCAQYQMVGQSLGTVAGAFGEQMTAEELKVICSPIVRNAAELTILVDTLLRSAIILRPFTPPELPPETPNPNNS